MGNIRNDPDRVIVTFEAERFLDEPLRLFRDGKMQINKAITMRIIVGWVLWSLLAHKMPTLDFAKMEQIEVTFDKESGMFVATIKKLP